MSTSGQFRIVDIKQRFGARIRELRKESGLSQEKLALKAGLDRTYIPSIEKGERNVSIQVIWKLSKALDVKLSRLMDIDEG